MDKGHPGPCQVILIPVLPPLFLPPPTPASSSPPSPSPAHRLRVGMTLVDAPEVALPKMLRHWSKASRESSKHAGSPFGGSWYSKVANRLVGIQAMAKQNQVSRSARQAGTSSPQSVLTSSTVTSKPACDIVMTAFCTAQRRPCVCVQSLTCLSPTPLSRRANGRTSFVSATRT